MKNVVVCKTENRSHYAINREKKKVFLLAPSFVPFIDDEKHSEKRNENAYYKKKYNYWKRHGLIKGLGHSYNGTLSDYWVQKSLGDLKQVVFEVTDDCNLMCKYCAYGQLYQDYDAREKNMLSFELAKNLIDYLSDLWKTTIQSFTTKTLYLSFYGGEPLLNMDFVKRIIEYVYQVSIENRVVKYSMTTNGVLLDKYMDYLAENEFSLLISLDGDEYNNSYRINHSGKNLFSKIIKNVDELQKKYPEYFEKYVNFNSVLHNRNSVEGVYNFFINKYGKKAHTSEISTSGINPDYKEEFLSTYKNKVQSIYESSNFKELEKKLFLESPSYLEFSLFLKQFNENTFSSFNDFFEKRVKKKFIPTGTCIPFSKKLFLTVNGKILPCERIGHESSLGSVDKSGVHLNYKKIADLYNSYFKKFNKQCATCYNSQSCIQCMFNIDNLNENKVLCNGYMNKKNFENYFSKNMTFWEEHPGAYSKILEEVVFY